MAWNNSDGLRVKFGKEEAVVGTAGELSKDGDIHEVVFNLTLASLASSATIIEDNLFIPKNARITEVEVRSTTAATGTNSTLNLGLKKRDYSTELDHDGLLAVAPLADFNTVGETKLYTIGVTGIGALAGTTLSESGYLVAWYGTAFDTGVVQVKVRWIVL